jgi:hypothetical protein
MEGVGLLRARDPRGQTYYENGIGIGLGRLLGGLMNVSGQGAAKQLSLAR